MINKNAIIFGSIKSVFLEINQWLETQSRASQRVSKYRLSSVLPSSCGDDASYLDGPGVPLGEQPVFVPVE